MPPIDIPLLGITLALCVMVLEQHVRLRRLRARVEALDLLAGLTRAGFFSPCSGCERQQPAP